MGTKFVLTSGVKDLDLETSLLSLLFQIAYMYRDEDYMIVFTPNEYGTLVTDGNHKSLISITYQIPETIWIMYDEYPDYLLFTALLPTEH